jgi:AraC-like DNA-binding protein
VGPLINAARLLRDFGCEPHAVFASMGVLAEQLQNADDRLPFVTGVRLLDACASATQCEHFGLLLGQQVVPAYLGLVGFLAQTASTVGEALQLIAKNQDLNDQGGSVTFSISGGYVSMGYVVHEDQLEGLAQISDMTQAATCGVLRTLCGQHWKPSEVWLHRKEPKDVIPYRKLFNAPLMFDQPQSALLFQERWLTKPLASSDSGLHQFLAHSAEDARGAMHVDLVGQLHDMMQVKLARQEDLSLEHFCREFDLHPRTLNRRLKELGTSFRDERDKVRQTYARQLLASTQMSVAEIAAALGYKESSSFDHAFSRWEKMSPAQWRAKKKSKDR